MKHGLSVFSLRGREGGHDGGFTLIELMVTIAIAAILAGLAIPSFKQLITSNRLKSHSSSLHTSLLLARSEAIKRNGRVVLCKSANGSTCTTTGNWQQGWIIFHDYVTANPMPATNGDGILNNNEPIIQKVPALSGNFILKGNDNVINYVSYSSTGATKLVSGGFQAGTFTLCEGAVNNANAREIIISATGRARVKKITASTCSD